MMKPFRIAKKWAAEHPDYSGLLTVVAQTQRGRGGRMGTKKTEYSYLVSHGKATRSSLGNGICDVTGKIHHKKELAYYHLPHPRRGEKPYPDSDVIYWTGWLYTSQEYAKKVGAKIGQSDGKNSLDGCYNEAHPGHGKQLVAWKNRVQIKI